MLLERQLALELFQTSQGSFGTQHQQAEQQQSLSLFHKSLG